MLRLKTAALTTLVFLLLVRHCHAGIFDTLKKLPAEQRLGIAEDIYLQRIKRADTASAIRELEDLINTAGDINDPALKSAAYSMLADKYARNYSFNNHSTALHLKAISIASANDKAIAMGIAQFKMGRYCYTFKKYPLAFEYLLRANELFLTKGYDNIPASLEFLNVMGSIYYETGDYDKAEYFFKRRVQQDAGQQFDKMQAYNFIASMAGEQMNYPKAMENMQQVLAIANVRRDTVWQGIASGIIGGIYVHQYQHKQAIPYLERGYRSNSSYRLWDHAGNNVLHLASAYLAADNISMAEKYLCLAQTFLPKVNTQHLRPIDVLKCRKTYYEVLALYLEKKGDISAALTATKELQQIKDSIDTQKDMRTFANIRLRIETENHLDQIAKLESDARTSIIERNATIAVLVLLMVTAILIYNRRQIKIKARQQLLDRHQELLESEKLRAEEELQHAQQQLTGFTENLRQKNELIDSIKSELRQLQGTIAGNTAEEERLEHFDKLLQATILTAEDWDQFRALFEKVHKGFIFRLKEKFPNLSENDIRLFCLMKLQLSRREMANMLGVSTDAVKKSKQRLRKKLSLDAWEENIELEDLTATI